MGDQRTRARAVVFLGGEYLDADRIPDRETAVSNALTLIDASGARLDEDTATTLRKLLELIHTANAAMLKIKPTYMCEYPYQIRDIPSLVRFERFRAALLRLAGDSELAVWWETNFGGQDWERQRMVLDVIAPYTRRIELPVMPGGGSHDGN